MSDIIANTSTFWLEYGSQLLIQNTLFLGLFLILLHFSSSMLARYRYLLSVAALVKLILPLFIPLRLLPTDSISNFLATYPAKIFVSEPGTQTNFQGVDAVSLVASINWIEILFYLWISGIVIYLLLKLIATIRLLHILHSAKPETIWLNHKISENRKIQIYISERLYMPLTHLFFPYRIYVPFSWRHLDNTSQNQIIQHELAHLRRHDNWLKLLQLFIQALYFFHPLVYILNKKIDQYREMACDDVSVEFSQISQHEYSKFLTEFAEKAVWTHNMYQSASAFIRQKGELYNRIKYQMEEVTMSSLSRKKIAGIFLILLLGTFFFSGYISSATSDSDLLHADSDILVVKVTVNYKNEIFIDDVKINLNKFKSVMQKKAQGISKPFQIQLTFDPQTAMQTVFSIQRQLQAAELLNVKYSNEAGEGLNLILPRIDVAEKLSQIDKKNILELYINSEGDLSANASIIDKSAIEKYLKENLKKNEYLIVAISAHQKTQYEDFVDLLNSVRRAQAKRVVIQSANQG